MKLELKEKSNHRMSTLIHEERKIRKISQQELCQKLGITQGLLSKIENAKLAPSVHVWLKFCELFKLKAEIATDHARFLKRVEEIKKTSKKQLKH